MKKLVVFILAVMVLSNCGSVKQLNQTVFDAKAKQKILLGYADRKGLSAFPYSEWFQAEFSTYKMDEATLKTIDKSKFNSLKIKTVMGTWCSDSQREVPRLYKILDYLGYEDKNISVIAVNRDKKADGTDMKSLNIEKVPTIIFYSGSKEVGRIIESPAESLEKDIKKIVAKL